MTRQEIFDRVVTHARKQKCLSVKQDDRGFTSCKYRGPNNTMCYFGIFIPDDEYNIKMEGDVVIGMSFDKFFAAHSELSEHREFLREIQKLHDTIAYNADFESESEARFELFAKKYNLIFARNEHVHKS